MSELIHPDLLKFAVDISTLNHDPKNTRTHDDRNIAAIKSSLAKFGQRTPIIVQRQGSIVRAGNGRLQAARELGWTKIAAVMVDDSDVDATAYSILDNRTAELAEWDNALLKIELADLQVTGLDLESLGFSGKDLDKIMGPKEGLTDDDAVPDAPVEPVTKPGDLWILGGHRLLCGDSTNAEDMAKLMGGGVKADMAFTDPPWNVAIGLDSNPRHRQREGLKNDNMSQVDFGGFLSALSSTLANYCSGDLYCVMGCEQWPTIDKALRGVGFHWSATIIWSKDLFVLGRSNYHRQYEPIWYGWPEGSKSTFQGGRSQSDIWEIPRPKRSEEHPTMKPVDLVVRAIENSSNPKSTVLDIFMGSGTTLLACEKLGRHARGTEISPQYCDVIVKRWEAFTGLKAVLA